MAAAVHHHSPGSSVGQATARRMSRNPQAQQQAQARGEAESAAAGGGWGEDVVPQLKRRLEAESAFLTHRLSPSPSLPSAPTPPPLAASPSRTHLSFPSSDDPPTAQKSPSKIPVVSPPSRARSRSRGAPSSTTTGAGQAARALQDVTMGGPTALEVTSGRGQGQGVGSYVAHPGEGSSGEEGARQATAQQAASPRGGPSTASNSRQRTKSTPSAVSPHLTKSAVPRPVSPAAVASRLRTPSPSASRQLAPNAHGGPSSSTSSSSNGVLPVGSPVRTGLKPLYLSPSASAARPPPQAQLSRVGSNTSSSSSSITPTPTPQPAVHHPATVGGGGGRWAGGAPMQPTWSAQSAYSSAASDGGGQPAQSMLLTPETTPSGSPLGRTSRLPVQDGSHSHSQQQTSWPSSSSPSSTTTPPHQHGPSTTASDRLIRDEVAPFQILSRDLRAVRADGRVELGRGDGFTERELVRQMPSVWRVSGVPTLDDVEGSLGALGGREERDKEEDEAHEREEEERKRLERKRELMEIARNGWDLDDEHLLLMASSTTGQGSKDTLWRSTNGTTADQSTPKTTGSLASSAAAAASPSARQKEEEARRRRREEGSARQRALSTSATLGRRSVSSGPSPASPAPAAGASTSKGTSTTSLATGAGRRASGGLLPSSLSKANGHAPSSVQKSAPPPSAMASSRSESTLARTVDRSKLSPGGEGGGSGGGSDEDGSNSIRLSLYGEDAVPPMADDKPTKDELMNWDSVVIPAVRKKKKHNPLLEWDDSISNPSTTPPSKAKTREPYTPPTTAPPPPPALSFGDEGKAEGEDVDDWPPPAPGTFGYKPPKERTPTTSTSTPPTGLTTGTVLQDKVDPANAGFASGSAGGDGPGASAVGSPTPSSTNFENVNGHRRMSKIRDPTNPNGFNPPPPNPIVEAQEQDEKLAESYARRRKTKRRKRAKEAWDGEDAREGDGTVGKSGCCAGCVVM